MSLITSRRFLPLFITQFLGAFNDNLLKNSLVILITYRIAVAAGDNPQVLVTLAAGIFILPFFLFSATAGQLADKYDRAQITRILKILEIMIMLLAAIGFILDNYWFLMLVLFASGTHSAFFGPIKYALLPQHLQTNELLTGNAYIEAGTFIAILAGTISGGLLILNATGEYLVSAGLVTCAVCGYISSRFIPVSPAPEPQLRINYNIWQATMCIIAFSRVNSRVFICILAISWFWFIGATFLAQLASYVKNYLHAEARVVTLFLTLFSVGIGLGSFICSKLLQGKISSVYTPIAAIGITVFCVDLFFASHNQIYFDVPALLSFQEFIRMHASWRIMADLTLIATCSGIYVVPLYAIMQNQSSELHMGRIIAANNVLNALFMVVSVIFTLGMLAMHRSMPEVFLVVGLVNGLVAYCLFKFLP